MHALVKHLIPRAFCTSLFLLGSGGSMAQGTDPARVDDADHTVRSGPLVQTVRRATARFRDISVALQEGWVQATPCVSGPILGAMGVHFAQPSRLADGELNPEEPELLIYEPLPGGRMRLVGVEFLTLADAWETHNPGAGAPSLAGHLLNFVGEPNRYGLPAFYEIHVWAWERNPLGSFADFNTRVSCDKQPLASAATD